jgi:hypothetical protein
VGAVVLAFSQLFCGIHGMCPLRSICTVFCVQFESSLNSPDEKAAAVIVFALFGNPDRRWQPFCAKDLCEADWVCDLPFVALRMGVEEDLRIKVNGEVPRCGIGQPFYLRFVTLYLA